MNAESPVSLLRQAAEAAKDVLPPRIGNMISTTVGRFATEEDIKYAGDAIFEIAREVLALAKQQQTRPTEATVYMARGIRPDSWLHEDRFTAFRHAYSYASAKTHAIPGLSKISAEEAYYVWRIIQHGFEFNERTKNDPRLGVKEES